MRIWVDADACPKTTKEILFRVANRAKIEVTFIANMRLATPKSPYLKSIQVEAGFDVADDKIVQLLDAGDLVITSDIPLASDVVDKGGYALSPRGELYTEESVKQRLNMRDFMESLRSSGVHTGGPATLSQRDTQEFANHLDRIITRNHRPHTEY